MRLTATYYMFVLLAVLSGCRQESSQPQVSLTYPVTDKVEQVDDYFGTKVNDPYRWLEDDTAPNVEEWVKAQNKVTYSYLDQIPFRKDIEARCTDLFNYPRLSSPRKAGDYYIFSKNDGLQNQSIYYRSKGIDGEHEVFLDPNTLSENGTVSVSLLSFSDDNKYVVYSLSEGGSDWRELRVKEVATGKDLVDELKWVKFSGAAWHGDGFYYSRYPEPEPGKELSSANKIQSVYYHKLGQTQDRDELLYRDPTSRAIVRTSVTEDGKYLLLTKRGDQVLKMKCICRIFLPVRKTSPPSLPDMMLPMW